MAAPPPHHGTNTMKYLITGAGGQIGSRLTALLHGKADVFAADRRTLDITRRDDVLQAALAFRPDVIINAAAYTAVDDAEREPETAFAVNATGAGHVAQAAQTVGAVMVQISTDYVFDGRRAAPYRETDLPSPLNVYGQSKYAGEQAVQAACARHLIVRTAWVFGKHGGNFVKTLLRLGRRQHVLNVVDDQRGNPTYADDAAAALLHMAEQAAQGKAAWGVYHFAGDTAVSRDEFARAVLVQAAAQGLLPRVPEVRPVSGRDYPSAAERPADSRLDCRKVQAAFGIAPSDWRAALHDLSDYFD